MPDALDTDLAALTEPLAVGEHAVGPGRPASRASPASSWAAARSGWPSSPRSKGRGHGPVLAADFSPTRRRLAEAFGADEVIDPAESSPHDRWSTFGVARNVMERAGATMLGGTVTDPVIFEAVGVPGMLQSLIADAPPHSRIVVVGVCMHSDTIEPFMAVAKEIEFRFSFGYTPAEFAATLARLAAGRARRRAAGHLDGRPGRRARAPSRRCAPRASTARSWSRLDAPAERRIPSRPAIDTHADGSHMTTIDADGRLKFGIFLAPFHPVGQNPTLALERDLQLIEHLDELGFDEAWFGEHHSAGYEIIASPEVFIAAAAQRTKHIRLGTGVLVAALPPPLHAGRPHGAARPPRPGAASCSASARVPCRPTPS